jgi:hypothetical protein
MIVSTSRTMLGTSLMMGRRSKAMTVNQEAMLAEQRAVDLADADREERQALAGLLGHAVVDVERAGRCYRLTLDDGRTAVFKAVGWDDPSVEMTVEAA